MSIRATMTDEEVAGWISRFRALASDFQSEFRRYGEVSIATPEVFTHRIHQCTLAPGTSVENEDEIFPSVRSVLARFQQKIMEPVSAEIDPSNQTLIECAARAVSLASVLSNYYSRLYFTGFRSYEDENGHHDGHIWLRLNNPVSAEKRYTWDGTTKELDPSSPNGLPIPEWFALRKNPELYVCELVVPEEAVLFGDGADVVAELIDGE